MMIPASWRSYGKPGTRVIVLGVLALAGIALALYGTRATYFRASASTDTRSREQPAKAVGALGRIEPRSEIINLGAGMTPDRLEVLLVARGDLVKKDQVLGYLGGHAEQVAQLGMFKAQLVEARLKLRTETALSQARIETAEINRRQVLEVTPLRIAAQEATIASLEAKLANDRDILESQGQLYSRGIASRRLNEDHKAQVAQDEANLASARARLAELKSQFEVEKINSEIQVTLAKAQSERAQAEFPIASLEAQIAAAESRARRMTLVAPIDGRILNVRAKPGEEVSGGPILTMGDTASMRAVAEVYETDIGQVRIGQSATIKSRALPRPLTGKVARIGNMIFKNDVLNVDPAARADARVVEVWIDLDDSAAAERLTNLTVDVVIDTSVAESAPLREGQP